MDIDTRTTFHQNSVSQLLSPVNSSPSEVRSTFKSRWSTAMLEKEKRQYQRRPLRCKLVLLDIAKPEQDDAVTIPADCYSICEGGLYGIVSLGYGVAMGQHYTFRLTIGERGPEPGSRQIVFQHGKIVRTELLLGESGDGDRIGIGVQLYGHRTGCIPMPSTM